MNRFISFSSAFVIFFAIFLTACGGGYGGSSSGSGSQTISQVVLFPAALSLNPGEQTLLNAAAENSSGTQLFSSTITYASSDSRVQVATNAGCNNTCAIVCAGTWDSLTAPTTCTAPPLNPGPTPPLFDAGNPIITLLTASANGINSTPTTATVHVQITSVQITTLDSTTNTPVTPGCISVGDTSNFYFLATAYNNSTPLTTPGQFSWIAQTPAVATVLNPGDANAPSHATATPVAPGLTTVTATLGSVIPVISAPAKFVTCPVKTITLTLNTPDLTTTPPEDTSDFHITLGTSASTSRTVTAVVTDFKNKTFTTNPTLSYFSQKPDVASVSSGTITGVANGATTITAACLPSNNCNINLPSPDPVTLWGGPIYSNTINGTVQGGTAPSGIAYATCSDAVVGTGHACTVAGTTAGTTQTPIVPINGTTAGTVVNLPHTPNSMMITRDGNTIYMGSSGGLMIFSTSANALTSTVTNAIGTVIGISPNGGQVVIAGATDTFIYSGGNITTLVTGSPTKHLTGAVAAAFTPDSLKGYIVGNNGGSPELWVYQAGITPKRILLSSVPTDVALSPNGVLGFVAQSGGGVPALESCNDTPNPSSPVSISAPHFIKPAPNAERVIVTDGANVDFIDVSGAPSGCPSGVTPTSTTVNAGLTSDLELLVDYAGAHAYVVETAGIADNTIGTAGSAAIALTANPTCTSTNASCAGLGQSGTIYVGGVDSKVHVDTGGAETATVTLTVQPDFVVSKK